jgi:hypothetical protein
MEQPFDDSQAPRNAEELANALERAGIDAEPILRLRPQLLELALLSKMSKTDAEQWSASLTLKAFYLRLERKSWIASPEERARCERLQQDPLASDDVRSAIDMRPARSDDGLFRYGEHILECSWCAQYAMGQMIEPHVHFVVIGDNGGMRCDPQPMISS